MIDAGTATDAPSAKASTPISTLRDLAGRVKTYHDIATDESVSDKNRERAARICMERIRQLLRAIEQHQCGGERGP